MCVTRTLTHMARRRNSRSNREYIPLDVARLQQGMRRVEVRRGHEYTVAPIRAERALKVYTCPGCHGEIPEGVAHVVVWRADSIWGDDAAIADRRHWHNHCWKVA
ncbi:hypothetical protein [Gulosibacter bifidus]